ncbi:MAG TPA: hypothetical protein VFC80_02340 [Sphaerochaeta sp.]|nr:hypothetical protein [Sphaerochaeta sp.]
MKKMKALVLVVSIVALLVSCGTTKAVGGSQADDWWNNPPADTAEYHYEVGMAKGTTQQVSRDWAKANANSALAQYVNNAIDTIVVSYVNDAGELATQNTQAVAAFESLSKQRAQATLTGVTYKYQTEEDGTVFVLAQLPINAVAEELKETLQESFRKNEAAAEANAMMNAAIEKYFAD